LFKGSGYCTSEVTVLIRAILDAPTSDCCASSSEAVWARERLSGDAIQIRVGDLWSPASSAGLVEVLLGSTGMKDSLPY
jgi:hypothetical protein